MTLELKFELDDSDLAHLRTVFEKALGDTRAADPAELAEGTRRLVEKDLATDPPAFIRKRLESLGKLATMVEDTAWQLPAEERERTLKVLAYFVSPEDVIPDSVPVLGLLDDAIATELLLCGLRHEIEAYDEFCQFRDAEMQRRANEGRPTDITKEDWLADRRSTLHSRMRSRSMEDPHGWHTITLYP
jgi:uncharacterized membrane protein YkvA (DUF1232 family)